MAGPPPSGSSADDLAGRVEALWAKAHQLSRMLERPDERTEPAKISQTAQELNTGLDKLVAQFVQERGRSRKPGSGRTGKWTGAAAAVLFPDDENLTIRKRHLGPAGRHSPP